MTHLVCPNEDCACKTGGKIPPCHYCGKPSDSNWVKQDLTQYPADERGPGRYWCLQCIDSLVAEYNIRPRPEDPPENATEADCLAWNTRRPQDIEFAIQDYKRNIYQIGTKALPTAMAALHNGQTFVRHYPGGTLAIVRGQASSELRMSYAVMRGNANKIYTGALQDSAIERIRPDIVTTPERLVSIMLDSKPYIKNRDHCVELQWVFFAAKYTGSLEEFQTRLHKLVGVERSEFESENGFKVVAYTVKLDAGATCDWQHPASITSDCQPPSLVDE